MMINDDPRDDPMGMWGIPACPDDGLDGEMWGSFGVPKTDGNDEIGDSHANAAPSQSPEKSVQRMASSLSSANGTDSTEPPNEDSREDSFADGNGSGDEEPDDLVLTDFCWKLRSGLGKFSVTKNHWERRRVVLSGTKLSYYKLTADEETLDTDRLQREQISFKTNAKLSDECVNMDSKSSDAPYQNISDPPLSTLNNVTPQAHVEPRGVLDVVEENASAQQACTAGAPTVYEVDVLVKGDVKWKFCFESPEQGSKWLRALEHVVMDDSREHGFAPGDHIIRWDMIFLPPIIWPIQIHGIVLEAGKNCVIIADFGLTSYGKQAVKAETLQVDADDDQEDKKVNEAFQKLFPKKQRLNVIALTDPREIRQWTKVNYGRNFNMGPPKGKLSKIKKLFKKSKKEVSLEDDEMLDRKAETQEAMKHIARGDKQSRSKYYNLRFASNVHKTTHTGEEQSVSGGDDSQLAWYPDGLQLQSELSEANHHISFIDEICAIESSLEKEIENMDESSDANSTESYDGSLFDQNINESDPDWFTGNKRKSNMPRCFLLEGGDKSPEEEQSKLPKSDPTKIVLARTNFVLENEKLLPPYHVLFSNSECIAVWCKTGRWSTLQTAVWCHVTAVGNAKTSLVTGMGVAAAHMFLVPLIAVGGLAFVTAPLLIYKKSKEKWEDATNSLTEKFWERAPPEVFVEAIKNWSTLAKDEE